MLRCLGVSEILTYIQCGFDPRIGLLLQIFFLSFRERRGGEVMTLFLPSWMIGIHLW